MICAEKGFMPVRMDLLTVPVRYFSVAPTTARITPSLLLIM